MHRRFVSVSGIFFDYSSIPFVPDALSSSYVASHSSNNVAMTTFCIGYCDIVHHPVLESATM
ncbi:hypothetical protein PRIPAC_96735, partial [Pristionchus pacificus]|uniref:Uncharacterized protein n=1 Tax=Pristionchus pacificus TaxID=54126 RepID=A0A2A6D1K2_PRIPA